MLAKATTTTMLPVTDVERAARFYAESLGLHQRAVGADGSRVFDTGNGNAIGLLPAGPGSQSQRTALSFEVADVRVEMRELERRGVAFADYDLPDLKTVDHIAELGNEKAAWFSDSEGNILCIHEVAG